MKARLCAALLVTLAVAGCSDKSTSPPANHAVTRQIDDLDYVKGQYFFILLPGEQLTSGAVVDLSTLRVFVDDVNGSNNQGVRAGYGEIDPTAPPSGATRLVGAFDELQPLVDYEVTVAPYGDLFPVLILKQPVSPYEVLAVAYEEVRPGGARRAVGSVPACAGAECDSIRLRLLQAPHDLLPVDDANPDFYENDFAIAPFNSVREHELRNVYNLMFKDFGANDLEISVHRYSDTGDAVVDGGEVVSYLQVLGVDLFKDFGTGAAAMGADQLVDWFPNATFLDPERGVLFFPDLRPFDPRIASRPDARPEDDFFFKPRISGTDQSIPGLRKRVFWPQGAANPPGSASPTTPPALVSNPNVYDKRNLQPTIDRRYYLEVRGPEGLAH